MIGFWEDHEETLALGSSDPGSPDSTFGQQLTKSHRPSRLLRKGRHETYVFRRHGEMGTSEQELTFETDFHLLRNHQWAPTINIEKLWSLVPIETRDKYTSGQKTDSAPVIDLLANGYAKLLGKGKDFGTPFSRDNGGMLTW